MPQEGVKEKTYTYVVESTKYGEFPRDMLRRDDSRPATPEDADLIERLCDFLSNKSDLPRKVRVRLEMTSERYPPNVERWESFGWAVIESNHPLTTRLSPSKSTKLHPDELRQKTIRALAQEVKRLGGLVHMEGPVFDAVRYSGDVAGQDPQYREKAIGFCEGVARVLATRQCPGLNSNADNDALHEILTCVRMLLVAEGDQVESFATGLQLARARQQLKDLYEKLK